MLKIAFKCLSSICRFGCVCVLVLVTICHRIRFWFNFKANKTKINANYKWERKNFVNKEFFPWLHNQLSKVIGSVCVNEEKVNDFTLNGNGVWKWMGCTNGNKTLRVSIQTDWQARGRMGKTCFKLRLVKIDHQNTYKHFQFMEHPHWCGDTNK